MDDISYVFLIILPNGTTPQKKKKKKKTKNTCVDLRYLSRTSEKGKKNLMSNGARESTDLTTHLGQVA